MRLRRFASLLATLGIILPTTAVAQGTRSDVLPEHRVAVHTMLEAIHARNWPLAVSHYDSADIAQIDAQWLELARGERAAATLSQMLRLPSPSAMTAMTPIERVAAIWESRAAAEPAAFLAEPGAQYRLTRPRWLTDSTVSYAIAVAPGDSTTGQTMTFVRHGQGWKARAPATLFGYLAGLEAGCSIPGEPSLRRRHLLERPAPQAVRKSIGASPGEQPRLDAG